MEKSFTGPKTYQVWHDPRWPEDRQNEPPSDLPPPQFPEQFIHVADVRANGLREAVEKTTDKGGILDDAQPWTPWEKNENVEAMVIAPRDTVAGDVIVDPSGRPYRVEREGFTEIEPRNPILEEMRADYAAREAENRPEDAFQRELEAYASYRLGQEPERGMQR